MSIKKIVGLLAGFALAVGLIGAGVGATFTDSVTASRTSTSARSAARSHHDPAGASLSVTGSR